MSPADLGNIQMTGRRMVKLCSLLTLDLSWAQAQLPFPTVAISYFSYILYGLVVCHPNFPHLLREFTFFSKVISFLADFFFIIFFLNFFKIFWLQTKFSLIGPMSLQIIVFEESQKFSLLTEKKTLLLSAFF